MAPQKHSKVRAGAPPSAPGLSVVEMEVCSRCNRRCPYCPVSLDPMPAVPARMSDEVFRSTVDQLAEIGFAGRISYHLYNEPLLRTDLHRLVGLVHTALPDALQVLNTNGDLLDDRRYAALRAAGIDYFYVTRHSPGDYPERPFQVVQTWRDLTLTNRGGTLTTTVPAPTEQAVVTPCFAPSEMLIVTVTGDVLLCYEDAGRRHVLGNVMRTQIAQIWQSPAFRAHRERLEKGNRAGDEMCRRCSNVSHRRPGLSALEDPVLRATHMDRGDSAVAVLKELSERNRDTLTATGTAVR
jgi:cyclic pyranopterin phosphate synthase